MNSLNIYHILYSRFGPQYWWPSCAKASDGTAHNFDARFEIAIGAILTQNTAWTNVEKALYCLIEHNLLDPRAILKTTPSKLAQCIRSSGYYTQKSKKLKIFSAWLIKNYSGDLLQFKKQPLKAARKELLSLWGIGEETADSILLYALEKQSFVIDAYTRRLCEQFNITFKTYEKYKNFFESQLPRSVKLYNEYHALIVAWGKLLRINPREARTLLSNQK